MYSHSSLLPLLPFPSPLLSDTFLGKLRGEEDQLSDRTMGVIKTFGRHCGDCTLYRAVSGVIGRQNSNSRHLYKVHGLSWGMLKKCLCLLFFFFSQNTSLCFISHSGLSSVFIVHYTSEFESSLFSLESHYLLLYLSSYGPSHWLQLVLDYSLPAGSSWKSEPQLLLWEIVRNDGVVEMLSHSLKLWWSTWW